jgi:hypothetical protein
MKRRTSRGKVMPKTPRGRSQEPFDLRPDDGGLHVVARPNPAFGPPPSIVETVLFGRIGHAFGRAFSDPEETYVVQDFLLDQTGISGCDGKIEATKSFDLTTTTHYRFNVFPRDRAKRVKVVPPPGGDVFMALDTGRRFVNATYDVSDVYTPITFFQDLIGPAPGLTYDNFFIGRNTNHWLHFLIHARANLPFQFFGLVSIGTYPVRTFDPGLKSYEPYAVGAPIGLGGGTPPTCSSAT